MKYVLALDEGTTSSRALIFDETGKIVSLAQKEFSQSFVFPGWVEHNAEEIWSSQIGVAIEALNIAGLEASSIAALGITNQRETTVIWDRRTSKPIAPAIVWQDRRTADFCERLRSEGFEQLIRQKTGLLIDAYFSASKITWLLENVPDARRRAEAGELAFGTIDSWLAWKLSGGKLHITDSSNASRTMLYNIHSGSWDRELLHLFGVPESLLPEVKETSQIYGEVSAPGLAGIPIAGMAGDQQAALFGQTCVLPGLTKNTYGTGCFMLQNTGDKAVESQNRLLTTIAWTIGGKTTFALEGSVFIAGAVIQWLRDGLRIIRSSEEVNDLARTVPDNGGVYLIPAFTGLGAPYWDPHARGTLTGITRGTTAGHIARAALESIAFQSAELFEAMLGDASQKPIEIRVDGGASRSDLLMQFQADVLGVPVVRPAVTETTAQGAAYLAGLATGVWNSYDELASRFQVEKRFEPQMKSEQTKQLLYDWKRAVARSRGWANGS